MDNRNSVTRPFGEPFDKEAWKEIVDLLTDIDEDDMADAIDWWDDNASPEWVGSLDNKPTGQKKKR